MADATPTSSTGDSEDDDTIEFEAYIPDTPSAPAADDLADAGFSFEVTTPGPKEEKPLDTSYEDFLKMLAAYWELEGVHQFDDEALPYLNLLERDTAFPAPESTAQPLHIVMKDEPPLKIKLERGIDGKPEKISSSSLIDAVEKGDYQTAYKIAHEMVKLAKANPNMSEPMDVFGPSLEVRRVLANTALTAGIKVNDYEQYVVDGPEGKQIHPEHQAFVNEGSSALDSLARENALAKPTAEDDPEEPAAQDDPEEPAAEDDPEEPAAEDDPEEPAAQDDPEEPAAEDDPEEPVAEDDPEEPATEDDPEEPAAEDDPEEPAAEDDPEEPAAEDDPEEPAIDHKEALEKTLKTALLDAGAENIDTDVIAAKVAKTLNDPDASPEDILRKWESTAAVHRQTMIDNALAEAQRAEDHEVVMEKTQETLTKIDERSGEIEKELIETGRVTSDFGVAAENVLYDDMPADVVAYLETNNISEDLYKDVLRHVVHDQRHGKQFIKDQIDNYVDAHENDSASQLTKKFRTETVRQALVIHGVLEDKKTTTVIPDARGDLPKQRHG